jgi:hypothetical protein
MKPVTKRPWLAAMIAALAMTSTGAAGQTSGTCEFTVAALFATRIELQNAKKGYQECMRSNRTKCTAEESRMRELEQHLKLLSNYLDRYCMR